MGLFGFGRKKEEKAPACACQQQQPAAETAFSGVGAEGVRAIKVLGTGCTACHTLLQNAETAAADLGLDLQVEYVTDMAQIAGYGVMQVPALVVNETVAAMGKVLKPAEIADLLRQKQG